MQVTSTGSNPANWSRSRKADGGLRGSVLPCLRAEDLAATYGSHIETGLTGAKALQLLKEFGPNELEASRPTPFILIWVSQFKDVLLLIIACAGMINMFGLSDKVTGSIMIMTFFGASLINAIGEWSVAEGGTALAGMGAPLATVHRDGKETQVKTQDLVPGDIVLVRCGDTVPADMRCASANDLRVDESVLTGESQEVTKTSDPSNAKTLDPFPANMLYSSTAVVSGRGVGVVTATGMATQVGMIAQRLDVGVPDLSPLQQTMNRVGGSVGVAVFVIIFFITGLCFFTRYQDPSKPCAHDNLSCYFMTALSQGLVLGVALVPTTMPVMITLLLYVARKQIQAKSAVVRKTSTVETLGSCMVICSDKTGTLTEGKMTAVRVVLPRAGDSALPKFSFWPTAGADPAGGIFKEEELTAKMKQAVEEYLFTKRRRKSTIFPLRNYGEEWREEAQDADHAHVQTLLVAASLSSYGTRLERQGGKWATVGNLSEGALVVAAAKAGIGPPCETLTLRSATDQYPPDPEVEVPFTSARKMMSTVHSIPNGTFVGLHGDGDISHIAILKGAPDRLLPMADKSVSADSQGRLVIHNQMPDALVELVRSENDVMASDTLRVLVLCVRLLTSEEMRQLRSLEDAEKRLKLVTSKHLAVLGVFGILDPPRSAVGPSVAKCKSAGIRVVMITGDQLTTAVAIAKRLDIIRCEEEARLCSDLYDGRGDMLPEDIMDAMVHTTHVWARAQPSDKVAIVESLQRMGNVTAMTGDGVNDAPALKLADIGTAMGITGTEVAKGSADIVLMNDDFTTIVEAVQEGRRTYANVQVYVTFYLSLSIPEVVTYAICMLSGMPLPITALQVLMQAVVSNLVPPLLYCMQPIPKNAMSVSPRRKESMLLSRGTLLWLVIPWGLFWSACWTLLLVTGLWMHTGFVKGHDIVGTSTYQVVEDQRATCEFAGVLNEYKVYRRDREPFHCYCPVRLQPFAKATKLEQWGITVDTGDCQIDDESCVSDKRETYGVEKLEMRFGLYGTPIYSGDGSMVLPALKQCQEDGSPVWCWEDSLLKAAGKPLLDSSTNCGVLGSNVAHTMCFVANCVAKLLLVFAVSSERPLLQCFHLNVPLASSVAVCTSFLLVIVYLPVVVPIRIPAMQPLHPQTLATALLFPLASHVVLDLFKIVFRADLRKQTELKRYHAYAISKGLLTAQATDEEIAMHRAENPMAADSMLHRCP